MAAATGRNESINDMRRKYAAPRQPGMQRNKSNGRPHARPHEGPYAARARKRIRAGPLHDRYMTVTDPLTSRQREPFPGGNVPRARRDSAVGAELAACCAAGSGPSVPHGTRISDQPHCAHVCEEVVTSVMSAKRQLIGGVVDRAAACYETWRLT